MPQQYKQFWISRGLRAKLRAWWDLSPRFRNGLDTDFGGVIIGDLPIVSPHTIPASFRSMDLYLVELDLVEAVLTFARAHGGRIVDDQGNLTA